MIIRVEPREFFMSTVYLIFDREQAEPEDEEVRRFLSERQLEPRRTFETTYQEHSCEVWQFGGCYLGAQLNAIADIQKRYIEAEMLTSEIPRLLKEGADAQVQHAVETLPEARFQDLVGILAKDLHQESSFGPDEAGNLKVTLDPAVVQQRFKGLLTAS